MHEILFRGQTLHFKNTLAGGTQPFISYFPPVSEARRSICFPVFVPDAACQVVSVAGRRAHVRSSSLVTDERDDGAGRYWWKMKERTVCRTLPGCGGHPGGEIGQMLRSVSAGLCFTITTAAEGWGVCTHLNLGFLTRRRQPRSLKPFCNENPLSRRSESDISTSYLDLFAAPLYLFAFSLNVSSLILELLLGVRFVFFAAWPEIPWSLSPRTFVPAAPEQRPWLRVDDKRRSAVRPRETEDWAWIQAAVAVKSSLFDEHKRALELLARTKQGSVSVCQRSAMELDWPSRLNWTW